MTIGDRIKELRKEKRLTQRELADKINVSSQVISNWERTYSTPDAEDVKRLADALGTSVDYIIGRVDDPITWQTVDDVVTPIDPEIAEEMKVIGVEAIKLTSELIKNGLTREQLMELLKMIKNMQNNKK